MSRSTAASTPSHVVLRGGTVVDGTGSPGRRLDVELRDGRIGTMGEHLRLDGATVVDVGDLVVAPGFIDLHTHYDAQVLWDPGLAPSVAHGVTSVVMGNCGFTLAPTRPDRRGEIVSLLSVVEGMSAATLDAGIDWSFETFPEYVRAVEARPLGVNVGPMVGHEAVRRYVMGDDALTRPATPEECDRMAAAVAEAVRAGAFGFSSDRSGAHVDADGVPVACSRAEASEVEQLCRVAVANGARLIEIGSGRPLLTPDLVRVAEDVPIAVSPSSLLTGLFSADEIGELLELVGRVGPNLRPQVSPLPRLQYVTLAGPVEFVRMSPAFTELLALGPVELRAAYANPEWRARASSSLTPRARKLLETGRVAECGRDPELVGTSIARLAAERATDPFTALVDASLEGDLSTRFVYSMYNDDENAVAALLSDERTVLGLSDAGAHSDRTFDANYPTYLLARFVRERKDLSLEAAVARLTGDVAELLGLGDRGRIVTGAAADVVVFDPVTVGTGPPERRFDLPAGGERLLAASTGMEQVWINGVAAWKGGGPTAGAGGRLLRPARHGRV